jgi:hypothetical protein
LGDALKRAGCAHLLDELAGERPIARRRSLPRPDRH